MRKPFNILLLDPTREQLLGCLAHASRGGSGGDGGSSHWSPVLDEIAEYREGRVQLEHLAGGESGGALVVVWWSDARDGKQVRIVNTDVADPRSRFHASRFDHDVRPPIWHVAPPRIYHVSRPSLPDAWLASCTCGATGRPGDLLWMGTCCGPCHDRREEGDPAAPPELPSLFRLGRQVADVVFAPTGAGLYVASDNGQIVHFSPDGEERILHPHEGRRFSQSFNPLSVSPDGRFLAAGRTSARGVRVIDLHAGSEVRLLGPRQSAADPVRLCFSPDSRSLAVGTEADSLEVWHLAGADWAEAFNRTSDVTTFAFSPGGYTLAAGSGRGTVLLLDPASGEERDQFTLALPEGEDFLYLEYTPDGRWLVLLTGDRSSLQREQRLRLWDVTGRRELRHAPIFPPAAVALSPRGDYLAWFAFDERVSPAAVQFWDVARWQPAGSAEWNPEEILSALAFSPDGQTLATGSMEGNVKLYPWRHLLEG